MVKAPKKFYLLLSLSEEIIFFGFNQVKNLPVIKRLTNGREKRLIFSISAIHSNSAPINYSAIAMSRSKVSTNDFFAGSKTQSNSQCLRYSLIACGNFSSRTNKWCKNFYRSALINCQLLRDYSRRFESGRK